ncbi:venom carboxylesterase-6-like [Cimex lectularius]|uniref:Carboxylic ester hydrolase n=1 Tax=Cimex lectularius TaxID=79782 RepID=A0A8I6S289_CIMLE|nr:venom carboxylesterase-6-like [Cimex lectularius]
MDECVSVTKFLFACGSIAYIGKLTGYEDYTTNRTRYMKFEGIRYAHKSFSESRFLEPYPITTNESIGRRVDCMEVNPEDGLLIGEEDCLFLNVFVPLLDEKKSMPVMIWIHGRAFPLRNNRVSIYNPEPLMDHEMIVVTLAYRLGPLGVDHWREPLVDFGVKDQQMAIKWVLKNIHMFGGDPEKITLAGESGGAVYALHHVNGYFKGKVRKAIALSGFRYSQWAMTLQRWTKSQTQELFHSLKCDNIECMREKSAKDIVRNAYELNKKNRWLWRNIFDAFRPGVCFKAFEAEPWFKAKEKGNHSLLIGLRRHEGDIIDEFSSMYNTSVVELGRYYCRYSYDTSLYGMQPRRFCRYPFTESISSLYHPDFDLVTGIKKAVGDGWVVFPACVEVSLHPGNLEGFMYESRMCGAIPHCTLQCKVPFMKIDDGCPPYREEYEPVASQFRNVIADFVHGRNLTMKHFIEDNDFFNITDPLINPVSYSHYFISPDLAVRMDAWTKYYFKYLS